MDQFSDLPLSELLQRNLAANNLKTPTPVQAKAIPPALTGSNIVATAQTGTGKTLAFLLPILQSLSQNPVKGVQAVIMTPTRELAIQIHEAFMKLAKDTGLRATVVVGGLNEGKQLFEIQRGSQVLVATPGRLFDFIGRKLVKLGNTKFVVLDEADRMLDMGFLPVIEQILSQIPIQRQTLFFSATIERSIVPLIAKHVPNPVRVEIGATTKPGADIDLHVYEVEAHRKLGLLRHLLEQKQGSFLVFARTKHSTDRLAKRLARTGIKTAAIHGDRTQSQRRQALEGFKDGYYRVLVATDVAARGIHVDGIEHVVNFDLPQAPEDFIHRAGRTGRAGQKGTASTFATSGERGAIRQIERAIKTTMPRQEVPRELPADPADGPADSFGDRDRGYSRDGYAREKTPPTPYQVKKAAKAHSPKPKHSFIKGKKINGNTKGGPNVGRKAFA
ncbi:DEAD/DEAH box helicase [Bryobacter aggregatus]|uniref:DEAD/DEAH box helicase n=1 Tax=Bryobacter aggregatus TaxID=360054 RepID=UPI0009B5A82D|nr:DEAD/DEAH box helicase [Bryobacter aggregatus]